MKKKLISLNESEWKLAIRALNDLRTRMIADGRYTDVLDELIMKIIKAPIKKIKVA